MGDGSDEENFGIGQSDKSQSSGNDSDEQNSGRDQGENQDAGDDSDEQISGIGPSDKNQSSGDDSDEQNSGNNQGFPKKDPLPTHLVSWEVEERAENVLREFQRSGLSDNSRYMMTTYMNPKYMEKSWELLRIGMTVKKNKSLQNTLMNKYNVSVYSK